MPIRLFTRRQLRSWRDFAREIAVIVAGVLIALGASQIAEDWNWSRRVADAERQLAFENGQAFAVAAEAAAAAPCLEAQLVALRERILASGAELDPAPLHAGGLLSDFVFRAPSRPLAATIWRALSESGTVTHLEDWRHFRFAELESLLVMMGRLGAETDSFVGRIRLLGMPIALDAATRARLLEAIEEQRYRSQLHSVVASQVMAAVRDLDNQPTPAQVESMVLSSSGTIAFCREQGMPIADWQRVLASIPPAAKPQ